MGICMQRCKHGKLKGEAFRLLAKRAKCVERGSPEAWRPRHGHALA